MDRNKSRSLQLMVLVFVILNALFIAGRGMLEKRGIDQGVVLIGNVVVFAVSFIAFMLTQRTLENKNPHVFVRAVYSGFIIKFFILVIAAFIYFQLVETINKPALFVMLILYLVYTFLEVSSLLRLLKGKKNG
jgi:hypothetical protein